METEMSNLQIYMWIGVPALTILIGIGILLDHLHYRAIMKGFNRIDGGNSTQTERR
jgi:hypothetical protein